MRTLKRFDPELTDRNLPPYPPLSGSLDISKVEEIRRTVYLSNLDKEVRRNSREKPWKLFFSIDLDWFGCFT